MNDTNQIDEAEFKQFQLVWSRDQHEHRGKLHNDDRITLFVVDAAIPGCVLLRGAFVPDAEEVTPTLHHSIQAAKFAAELYLADWCRRFGHLIF